MRRLVGRKTFFFFTIKHYPKMSALSGVSDLAICVGVGERWNSSTLAL